MSLSIIPGAEPWSVSGNSVGVLCIHGFTGNPGSMRGLAEASAAAGYSVELPLLPGHGTVMEDMLPTRWADWSSAAEAAYQDLAARTERVIVMGLSMGGTLTLWLAAQHPEIAGIVCVNPAAMTPPAELLDVLRGMVDSGEQVMAGIGSDIADPDVSETAYAGTPLAALLSLAQDGIAPLADRFAFIQCPMLLMTSPQDHVVDPAASDFVAERFGGALERVSLERSYHVATLDYDKGLIEESAVAFVQRVAG